MNTATTRIGRRVTTVLGAAAAVILGTLSLQTANAASQDAPAIVVKYDAATVSSANGARVLYRRIETAARQVCPDDATKDLTRAAKAHDCQKNAVARAVRKIDNPRLAKLLGDLATRG